LPSGGARRFPLSTDVTSQESIDESMARAVEQFGPVDVLVANSGISPNMTAHEMDVPLVEETMRVNFFGVVYAMNAVLPAMCARGDGVILAVSSLAAFRGLPKSGPYCASKSAVSAWMESLRTDLVDSGVTLITSHPGYIRTAMTAQVEIDMPYLVEAEDAARLLVRGIQSRASEIDFPWQLVLMVKLAGLLPNRLYDRAMAGTNRVSWGTAARDACLWLLGGVAACLAAWLALRGAPPSTAATLKSVYAVGFPLLGLASLVISRQLRGSSKVPILIVVLGLPLAAIAAAVLLLGQ
jgi:short-subunit dehydrogenase